MYIYILICIYIDVYACKLTYIYIIYIQLYVYILYRGWPQSMNWTIQSSNRYKGTTEGSENVRFFGDILVKWLDEGKICRNLLYLFLLWKEHASCPPSRTTRVFGHRKTPSASGGPETWWQSDAISNCQGSIYPCHQTWLAGKIWKIPELNGGV